MSEASPKGGSHGWDSYPVSEPPWTGLWRASSRRTRQSVWHCVMKCHLSNFPREFLAHDLRKQKNPAISSRVFSITTVDQ